MVPEAASKGKSPWTSFPPRKHLAELEYHITTRRSALKQSDSLIALVYPHLLLSCSNLCLYSSFGNFPIVSFYSPQFDFGSRVILAL